MVISLSHAYRLLRAGKATCVGTMADDDGHMYWIIDRHDLHRTDHVKHVLAGHFWHLPLLGTLKRGEK